MNWFKLEKSSSHVEINIVVSIAIFCWFVWKFRNGIVFDNENESPFKIFLDSCRLIHDLNEVL